jgi:hypothetical protein
MNPPRIKECDMRHFCRIAWCALTVAAVLPAAGAAQVVVETERGPLEVIGLHRWTYQQLEDSLALRGESLRSHACAAVLQGPLGFPSAAVNVYMASPSAPPMFVVTVVEPEDSAWATRRTIDAPAGEPAWPAIRAAASDSVQFRPDMLMNNLQFTDMLRELGRDSVKALLMPLLGAARIEAAIPIIEAVQQRSAAGDLAAALRILATDGDADNRMLAAAVLSNFPASDAAWYALVAGLRDPSDRVAGAARSALNIMRQTGARPIDWAPAVNDLAPLLAGAYVWAFGDLLSTLVATEIDPALAPMLLVGSSHLLLSHARAQFERAREPAAAFLGRMSGAPDAGADAWEAWAASLRGNGR